MAVRPSRIPVFRSVAREKLPGGLPTVALAPCYGRQAVRQEAYEILHERKGLRAQGKRSQLRPGSFHRRPVRWEARLGKLAFLLHFLATQKVEKRNNKD